MSWDDTICHDIYERNKKIEKYFNNQKDIKTYFISAKQRRGLRNLVRDVGFALEVTND